MELEMQMYTRDRIPDVVDFEKKITPRGRFLDMRHKKQQASGCGAAAAGKLETNPERQAHRYAACVDRRQ